MLFTNGFNLLELIIKFSVGVSLLMTVALACGPDPGSFAQRDLSPPPNHPDHALAQYFQGSIDGHSSGRIAENPQARLVHGPGHIHGVPQYSGDRDSSRTRATMRFRCWTAAMTRTRSSRSTCSAQIRDVRALDGALALTHDKGPELSRAAAHCALRLDPSFIAGMLHLLRERDDWVRSRVETMLREVDPDALGVAMRDAVADASEEEQPRILDYVRFCPANSAHNICDGVLDTSLKPEALAAALRSLVPLASDRDHQMAVRFSNHEDSIVALSALRVLRKCVLHEDRELLVKMTSHHDYWVRLRAAEAAVQLFGTADLAREFSASLADPFARDAMDRFSPKRLWSRAANDR